MSFIMNPFDYISDIKLLSVFVIIYYFIQEITKTSDTFENKYFLIISLNIKINLDVN